MVTKEHRAMRREQMERWLASDGMTVEEWCRLNRMSTSTFYLWLNKFREEEPESFGQKAAKGWVEIAREERRDSLALTVVPAADAAIPAKRAGRGQTGNVTCVKISDTEARGFTRPREAPLRPASRWSSAAACGCSRPR